MNSASPPTTARSSYLRFCSRRRTFRSMAMKRVWSPDGRLAANDPANSEETRPRVGRQNGPGLDNRYPVVGADELPAQHGGIVWTIAMDDGDRSRCAHVARNLREAAE